MNVRVWMQRSVVGGYDRVPNDCFRLRDGGVSGGIRGGDVEEELFGVPVE